MDVLFDQDKLLRDLRERKYKMRLVIHTYVCIYIFEFCLNQTVHNGKSDDM